MIAPLLETHLSSLLIMTLVTYQLIRKHSNFLVSHHILEGNPVFINLFKFSGSQENTTLSVVRVNDTAGDSSTDVNITVEEDFNPVSSSILKEDEEQLMETDQDIAQVNGNVKAGLKISEQALETTDPLLALDQEEIEKIEHALQAEAFYNILPPEAGLDDLLDPELTGGLPYNMVKFLNSRLHCYFSIQLQMKLRLLHPSHLTTAILLRMARQ